MSVLCVVGARPNYMKMAPVVRALHGRGIPTTLLHTGQHYDANMSDVFFDELGMPQPDEFLGIGSDSQTRQTTRIMTEIERVVTERRPELVVVAGDVNSTMAVALVTAKMLVPLAHIESGLRSFDRTMPEEINRIVTDHLSDLLFTTEESGNQNLGREGIAVAKIHFVGNCMVDTLLSFVERAVAAMPCKEFGLEPECYALLTLHRPSNVDDPRALAELMVTLGRVAARLPLLFPVHPRTRERLAAAGTLTPAGVRLTDPLSYVQFLGLMAKARLVLTDSGGIQEETTVLDVPCLTLRANTERPVTLTSGSNRLVGSDPQAILEGLEDVLAGSWKRAVRPPLWDGKAAQRVVDVIQEFLKGKDDR